MAARSRMLLCAGAFAAGAVIAWFGRGAYDGSTVSAGTAAKREQSRIETAVVADRGIVAAEQTTAAAIDRVRVASETLVVDDGCTPGLGAIADDDAADLRAMAKARQDAAQGATDVRSKRP